MSYKSQLQWMQLMFPFVLRCFRFLFLLEIAMVRRPLVGRWCWVSARRGANGFPTDGCLKQGSSSKKHGSATLKGASPNFFGKGKTKVRYGTATQRALIKHTAWSTPRKHNLRIVWGVLGCFAEVLSFLRPAGLIMSFRRGVGTLRARRESIGNLWPQGPDTVNHLGRGPNVNLWRGSHRNVTLSLGPVLQEPRLVLKGGGRRNTQR